MVQEVGINCKREAVYSMMAVLVGKTPASLVKTSSWATCVCVSRKRNPAMRRSGQQRGSPAERGKGITGGKERGGEGRRKTCER